MRLLPTLSGSGPEKRSIGQKKHPQSEHNSILKVGNKEKTTEIKSHRLVNGSGVINDSRSSRSIIHHLVKHEALLGKSLNRPCSVHYFVASLF